LELKVIAASLQDRRAWKLASKYLENKDIGPETQKVLKVIGDYYERDESAKIADREIIRERILAGIPEHQEKHRDIFKAYLDRVPDGVSVENISEYIVGVQQNRIEAELHQALLARKDKSHLSGLMEKWRSVQDGISDLDTIEKEIYTGWDVELLVQTHHSPRNLIRLLPVTLDKLTGGGAMPGDHILVFAFTEVGKSLFCINLVFGFLKQGLRVLYIENEEPIARTQMRVINRITGKTKKEIIENYGNLQPILDKAGYKNFTIAGLSPGSFDEIKEITEEIDPHVVIFNQLGNLDTGVKRDGPTIQLLSASQNARNLAKKEARVVISVAQASDDAYGRAGLRKNDVQWSNVDLPGTLDLQVGIGCTEEMEQMGTRRITLCKDKLGGNSGEYFDCRFIKEISKVEELGQPA
jgi:archaellum biogenesis ATPase FlaH